MKLKLFVAAFCLSSVSGFAEENDQIGESIRKLLELRTNALSEVKRQPDQGKAIFAEFENSGRTLLLNETQRLAASLVGTEVTLLSEPNSATRRTVVNFKTEYTTRQWKMAPPFKNMEPLAGKSELVVDMRRGSRKRVRNLKPTVVGESLSFNLRLKEPDLTEDDVVVVYYGKAVFRHTEVSARLAAAKLIVPLSIAFEEQLDSVRSGVDLASSALSLDAALSEDDASESTDPVEHQKTAKQREAEADEIASGKLIDFFVALLLVLITAIISPIIHWLITRWLNRLVVKKAANEEQTKDIQPKEDGR